jgi:hypothetical protein
MLTKQIQSEIKEVNKKLVKIEKNTIPKPQPKNTISKTDNAKKKTDNAKKKSR